ncbi:unnamed protein product [Cyclocybe aegerita]|uniref:DNA replication regulator SLD2 n=1 Tax=Cyclocybe aegerita TaxID=1973307 RepID=A0A8S0XXS1_CYCAE|nr:unnamed protein product [Cyclocybe aegerita]
MAELATVRAEIKTWERSFKDINGRAATVDDIRQNNDIAAKYKLYKKLSKAAPPSTVNAPEKSKSSTPPSTPPRSTRPKDAHTLLLSKPRAIQPTAPLAAFNPFSPQKKQKGKEKEKNSNNLAELPRTNLFGKLQSTPRRKRGLSPDPFPPIRPEPKSSTASMSIFSLALPPAPTSAVSRARKRLRGEPVSPSPNKDKRRRVTSQTTLPFPRLNLEAPGSDDEGDDADVAEADSSFVDNSPVKVSRAGKLFPQLFEESQTLAEGTGSKGDVDMDMEVDGLLKPAQAINGIKPTKSTTRRTDSSKSVVKASTNAASVSKLKSTAIHANDSSLVSEASSSRSSTKRPLSDDEADEIDPQPILRSKSPLIPPSPPPSSAISSFNRPGKNASKAKVTTKGKKKAKVEGESLTDGSDELEIGAKLKVVTRSTMHSQRAAAEVVEDDILFDSDPILGYARFAVPRGPLPNAAQQEDGHVEIDLPDELRRVLAFQVVSSGHVSEDRLVQGLMYGRRVGPYNPDKGGEIWDVGEDNHAVSAGDTESNVVEEDDWEGEPVPWEVGEL